MRSCTALILCLSLVGCATSTGRTAGTIAAIGGTVATVDIMAQRNDPSNDSQSVEQAAPQLYVLGALLLVTAIAGIVAVSAETSAP